MKRIDEASALTLKLYDWNMTEGDELVGKAVIEVDDMREILKGISGKVVTRQLVLVDEEGGAMMGHDKQVIHLSSIIIHHHIIHLSSIISYHQSNDGAR